LKNHQTATYYDFGRYTLDPHLRMLRSGARLVPIQSICFDLLFALLRSGHHTMSKDELIASAWPDADASDANLAQRISHLRGVLGGRAERDRYIVTIPKQGYRFVARTTYRSHGAARHGEPTPHEFGDAALDDVFDQLFATNRNAVIARIVRRLADDDEARAAFSAQLAASTGERSDPR
jgi:DNA-binding winged helix-turn-helix (wHTH) protein